jgi:hypothetical protein
MAGTHSGLRHPAVAMVIGNNDQINHLNRFYLYIEQA